ncbi:uncharacterized protein KQ657_003565 [Scheffersomyces spartinae]|uniref:Uncharacterized protein n=1 Tax=Scheffersomyces spartinae TaxID=45513 RepID=A0A9P7V556_9ASCO|nr:uncharacterized protein KQ657_003565 [Scheffersomyces spartinae]KAG7191324.1 hypothetical protein KQ657_003565 [Scheffersomyces spartinae]
MLSRSINSKRLAFGSRFISQTSGLLQTVSPLERPVTVDRELPDPFAKKRQNRRYFWAYAIGVTILCGIIFNYEKTRSPIINSTMYFLRRSAVAKDQLGDHIDFKTSWPWIWGKLNTVQGDINIHFDVKGDKGLGELRLKAHRESSRHPFIIEQFVLAKDGIDHDLTNDPTIDFEI